MGLEEFLRKSAVGGNNPNAMKLKGWAADLSRRDEVPREID
jgi:hypothetical protein